MTSDSLVARIVQGYQATYYFDLFDPVTGLPFDLTGATQIVVSHPGPLPTTPVNEFSAAQAVLVTTGNTSNGSPTLAALASVAGIARGQGVVGAGIPANTTVLAVDTVAKTVTLSHNATATATGVSVTINTAINALVVGAAGAGRIHVTVPAFDSALLQVNPVPEQLQDIQISVTNADGSVTAFILAQALNVEAPPYGVQ